VPTCVRQVVVGMGIHARMEDDRSVCRASCIALTSKQRSASLMPPSVDVASKHSLKRNSLRGLALAAGFFSVAKYWNLSSVILIHLKLERNQGQSEE